MRRLLLGLALGTSLCAQPLPPPANLSSWDKTEQKAVLPVPWSSAPYWHLQPPPVEAPMPVIKRPGYRQTYAQVATYGGLALADYWTTQRGFRNHPSTGREANPLLACNGGRSLCTGRYVALNAGVTAGLWLVGRHVTPRLPRTSRRLVNGLMWAMLGGRAAVVYHNYKEGSR